MTVAHPVLIAALRGQPEFATLTASLRAPDARVAAGGLAGSSAAVLSAALSEDERQRLVVVVAASPPLAEAAEADLQTILGEESAHLYAQRETLPYEAGEHHLEVSGLRVEALEALLSGRLRVLVTTPRALQELSDLPASLEDLQVRLRRGDAIGPHELARRLDELGFERVPMVQGVGEYALRGGIVDLFGFGTPEPLRVEFWGDEIESIRRFDVLDQRSTVTLERADVLPVDVSWAADRADASVRRSLLDVLPAGTLLVLLPGADAASSFRATWGEVMALHESEHRRGGTPEPPDRLFLPPELAADRLAAFPTVAIGPGAEADVRFQVREPEAIDRDVDRLAVLLRQAEARGERTLILCDNPGQLQRLEELLGGSDALPEGAALALGTVDGGFVLDGADPPLRVLTDHEIFRRDRRLRRSRRFRGALALESLAQLQEGDYVVHLDHGIGRFRGMERVRVGDREIESLAIEYAGGEILRLPVYRLDLIERWRPDAEEGEAPRVHKIGGRSWKTMKRRTEQAIQEMASELLELYAARELARGHAFPEDTRWQREMESAFLYEDTPDQRQATLDVKADMRSPRPMDRLLCGDVGYGKTEVAVRAAFKAVQDGKQVAVLAPTTILVEQHHRSFAGRLADFPVRVEALSRFRTPAEQKRLLADLADGSIDIVIGTHRLLQPDVVFSRLGLVVVDEEQRFGVRHKEQLKERKRDVDVLSMTATPIPRTLSMALGGLRDLTLIRTPPRDRMPVLTHVIPWHDEVLEDAIRRELDRGGQVFVVHNRVQTIDEIAARVRRLVPGVPLAVAHGQMPAPDLEGAMRRFVSGEASVLVSTAIIENGLDVPTANTLIVHGADQFGLAQLYQLRGRVGRSHHRAYCYLVVPDGVHEDAERRLRLLEHFSELGSGYAIAMKDLELRGGGNILGSDQSGFVHAVGLETYTRLLEDTVRALRDDPDRTRHDPPEVALEGSAFIPDAYVPDPSQKLHVYRRLSRAEDPATVNALAEELADRFGPLPAEVRRLLLSTRLRLLGQRLGVERILLREDEARVNWAEGVVPRMASLQGAFRDRQLEVEVRRAMPLSLVLRRFGAEPLADTLAEALGLLSDRAERAA
ncbi:MAG TPA: transcription-repair coupling factor [Longimicrobiales bacterium]|nr:transcription-repair coupling factor [Longimicrobiales bacterium]